MTNEEAREIIKQFRDRQGNSNEDVEALDMAIKALEQQPCEDAISREAVKEMLTEEWTKYMPMESDVNLSFVLEKISELPSLTPCDLEPYGGN
jgi:predicted ABC-class ATPase